MMEFIDSNQTDNKALAFGLVYIIDFSETAATIDCSNFGEELNVWLDDISTSFDPSNADKAGPQESTAEPLV